MRTLSPTLLAAQKSASAAPYLRVLISDRAGGIKRLAWTPLFTGAEPDGYHAATMPGDGSLIRARVTGGRLYYQRVTTPGGGSDFSVWTDLGAAANTGVALCADGAGVLLFYIDSGGTQVKVRESSDNGATLGAAVTAATGSGAVTWLAADVKASGDAVVLYNVGANVFSAKRTSGAWAAPAAWTNIVASITGLAVYHHGDWNALVAGTDAAGQAVVWSAVFGDGAAQAAGTWSVLREITRASAGSLVNFRTPFLSRPDTYRLTYVEKYTGSVAYSRPYHGHAPASADFAANLWREPVPFDTASEYGQAISFSGAAVWLSTPSGVWTAALPVTQLDVTDRVVECETRDRPGDGRLRLVLRNDDGAYSSLPAPIALGAEVRVSPGYRTPNGAEYSEGPAYWVDGIERRSGGGEATVVLTGRDAWGHLEAWRARRSFAWAAGEKNVFGILQWLFARAGLEFSASGASSDATSLFPAFTVHPGDTALAAVRRLLATIPDVIFTRGEFVLLKEPAVAESATYLYGPGHPICRGRYGDLPATNRVQVFGKGVVAERFGWPGVMAAHDRLIQLHDANVTTQVQAEDRADAALRHAALATANGELVTAVNCGQELYDVVEVTDAGAGLSLARRRVLGLDLRYQTGDRSTYEHRITLGGV